MKRTIGEYSVIVRNGNETKVYGGYIGNVEIAMKLLGELGRRFPDADISIMRKVHECYAEPEPSIVDICKLNISKLCDKMKEALLNVRR